MKKVLAIVIMLSLLLLPGCAQAAAAENEAPAEAAAATPAPTEGTEASTVYFTSSITPEGMMAVYEALGWTPKGTWR